MPELRWAPELHGILSTTLGPLRLVVGPSRFIAGYTFTVMKRLSAGQDVWATVGSGHRETLSAAQDAAESVATRFQSAH